MRHTGKAVALVLGAILALVTEGTVRHRLADRIVEHPPDLAEWGMRDFYGSATVEEGLGPVFNATSCATCHHLPETGGTGAQVVLRSAAPGGGFFALSAVEPRCQPQPVGTEQFVRRIPTPLFGAGLVDAIPDAAIAALADPDDRDGDGVSGRAASVVDAATNTGRIGRFGWKAQDASLAAAVARAFAVEMGVTNRLFPAESAGGLDAATLAACDPLPDPEDRVRPETGATTTEHLTTFVRSFQPVTPRRHEALEEAGQARFREAGCAACHTPTLEALDGLAVRAYSDFLLHDVGTGDGIAQGAATGEEFRTAPLWGVGTRRLLMHDGEALTLDAAILRHAGEASGARDRFVRLAQTDRDALLAFLRSL